MEQCQYCGQYKDALDTHHIFGGANRSNSDKYECCKMRICRECHRYLHDNPIAQKQLKQYAQKVWEMSYGSREDFIKIFKKNYLWNLKTK